MDDVDVMREAIAVARRGIAAGQTPFGAAILRPDGVVIGAHNTVWCDQDPTCHAEINVIRAVSRSIGSRDLSGCTLYSTSEPCPMCLAACHWAKIARVVFGATIADAENAGFSALTIPASSMVEMGHSPVQVEGGLLADECAALFAEWQQAGLSKAY